jgi:hypothetical protein
VVDGPRQPRDIEYRQEQIPGAPRGYYQVTAHDPEDADYTPPPIEPKTLVPGRMLSR